MTPRRRQEILDAALELVTAGGLEALTISALTARSGASNGSVYHHFGSRGGVVAELYRASFAQCVEALVPALDDRPAVRVVPELAGHYLDWVATHPARARFIYDASVGERDAEVAGRMAAAKSTGFAPVAEWFAVRIAAGELRPLPFWALDTIVMGPAHECARRFLAGAGIDLAAARPWVTGAVWAIVRPD